MGRKQHRQAIWNSFKQQKKLIREKGGIADTNVEIIDPEQQKKKKLARKLLEKLAVKHQAPSKAQLKKLSKLREHKRKEKELKSALADLENHQLGNKELSLLVATKHVCFINECFFFIFA